MNITLCEVPLNNHGCSGSWLELQILDSKEAVVVAGGSCSSCWQVGHDSNEPRFKIGTKVCLPDKFRDTKVWHPEGNLRDMNSDETYFDSFYIPLLWSNGAHWAGYSHNECVDDSENPQPDTTLLRPSDLIISLSNF